MGCQLFALLLLAFHPLVLAQEITRSTVVVNGGKEIAVTSENFICATVDWWPHDKCNYDQCPWGYSSIINLQMINNAQFLDCRLMGKTVLAAASDASPYLRSYVHCSKGRDGITLLFINLSNQTSLILDAHSSTSGSSHLKDGFSHMKIPFMHGLRKTFSWTGSEVVLHREEYHLTPKDGDLQSQTMNLNGKALELSDQGDIPKLEPRFVDVKSPIYISPSSIAFIAIPSFDAPACN